MKFWPYIFTVLLTLTFSCSQENQGDETPKIEIIGLSKHAMKQGDLNQDSVWLQFRFEDGDGDFGYGVNDSRSEIKVFDNRTNLLYDQFKIPELPPSNGAVQKGTIQILLFTSCCLFPNGIPPCSSPPQFPEDSLRLKIHILDRAGNMSNEVVTDKITLFCI
ncbi:MAG: hypothetical protein IPM34_08025 [Saprospiraceae bacterium]|nr:hypothetical protein [Saprospiraceae bacterium]